MNIKMTNKQLTV